MDRMTEEIQDLYKRLFEKLEVEHSGLIKEHLQSHEVDTTKVKLTPHQNLDCQQYRVSITNGSKFVEMRVNSKGKVIGIHKHDLPFCLYASIHDWGIAKW